MDKIGGPLTIEDNPHAPFKSLSKGTSLFVIGIGSLVLAGWALDIDALKTIVPALANMKSNTALLLVLSGVSLWMQTKGQTRRVAQTFGLIVAFAGLLTLGEYVFNRDFGIDQLLFRDATLGALYPGRMAPATALAFLLIGVALMSLDSQPGNPFHESLVIIVFAICGLALIGYLYGVSSLYQIGAYTSMAMHTALCFVLLSIAILFSRPEQGLMQTILADTAGGSILRRLLPVVLVGPILLGWIGLWGQRAGLYDTAFGIAIMAISGITSLFIIIWFNAAQVTAIDARRGQSDRRLKDSELRLHSSLEDMMEGCQILGYDWRYLYINRTAEKHNRRPSSELMGNVYMDMWPGIEKTDLFPLLSLCMKERTPQRMLNEFTYPNGSLGWFEISIQPVPDGIFILSGDVTDRKLAQQALFEHEMKLSKLFEILPVGISILNAERKVSYTNPALKKIFELSEEDLLTGRYRNRKFLRAEGSSMPVDELPSARAFNEKKEVNDVEIGMVKEDGGIVWANVSAVPVNFPDWKVVMVSSDITERKKVEETKSYLAAVVESSNDAIISKDLTGIVTSWNIGAQRIFGFTADEMIGQSILRIIPPDHIQEEERILNQIAKGEIVANFETVRLAKDGKQVEVSLAISPVRDVTGKVVGASKVARDITERKQTEAALRESEEKFSAAFHSSPISLFISTLDGELVEVNRAFCELIGYSDDEIIGNTIVDLGLLNSQDRKKLMATLNSSGGSMRNFEARFRMRDGSLRDVIYSLEIITFRGKSHRLSTGVDITERKQAEREIRLLNTELEGKVAERTSELAAANEQLQELSIVDDLTGLYNRRGFLLLADQQLSLARRVKRNLLVFYADLDGLKQINDSSGHTAGDYALLGASHALQKTFRTSDIKARLGGDEFIVLAVEAEEHSAPILLARLHERLAEKNQSMSVGVVICDAQNEISMEDLIARADEAMYIEKLKKPGRRES